ncbi:hypothetical protein HD806DRAFT_488010 [Xylariaceae sp. AK1471]|nr:hypothetical protein HD806DRAFT_488010 [Xylariaceae sp. AK1471]
MMALPPIPANLQLLAPEIQNGWGLYQALLQRVNGNGQDIPNALQPGQQVLYNSANYTKTFGPNAVPSPATGRPFFVTAPGFPQDNANNVYWNFNIDRIPFPPPGGHFLDYHGKMRNEADQNGVMYHTDLFRYGDPLFWSEAVYYHWLAFCNARQQPPANLRWIAFNKVENEETVRTIDTLHVVLDNDNPHTWTPANNIHAFCALLGTDLGVSAMRLFTQHYNGLGNHSVLSVRTEPAAVTSVPLIMFQLG